MKKLSKGDDSKRYKCHKGCSSDGGTQKIYDKSTIQKLTEIFNFDYHSEATKTDENRSNEYTYNRSPCEHAECDANSDSFLYEPLETFASPSYPLSLPPPRPDDDIQPVSSRHREDREDSPVVLNKEKQLLLHDLLGGEIYWT